VVGAAGLGARPDRRALPAAERLTTDNRPRDRAIDVEVAGFHPVDPARDLAIVQCLDPAGQSERRGVGEIDRVLEVGCPHHAQHGAEALRAVKEAAWAHAHLDAGRPELSVVARGPRLEEPLLTLVEDRERAPERSAG